MYWFYLSLAGGSVLLAVVAQIVLKKSADEKHESAIREFVNYRTVIGYGMFTIGFCMSAISYEEVPLYLVPIIDCAGYILILIMGHFFLNDLINLRKTGAIALIVVGILVFKMGDIIAALAPAA